MNKISAVIITFNEEKNIERCLKSLIGIADEIIVLDSFSTDKTEQICNKYKVKFVQHVFDGHIQQKNRVMNMASNNYVLSLDADEVLSEKLKKSILEIKENLKFDAYKFNRLNIYCGKAIKHGEWYPDAKIRLWNKSKGKWGGTNPHDTVIIDSNATMKRIKNDIIHYSYNSIEEHINQTNKFSTISAEALFRVNRKSNLLIIFFKTFFSSLNNFVFKLAFLDGFYGVVIGSINVFAKFLKYSKLRKLRKEKID